MLTCGTQTPQPRMHWCAQTQRVAGGSQPEPRSPFHLIPGSPAPLRYTRNHNHHTCKMCVQKNCLSRGTHTQIHDGERTRKDFPLIHPFSPILPSGDIQDYTTMRNARIQSTNIFFSLQGDILRNPLWLGDWFLLWSEKYKSKNTFLQFRESQRFLQYSPLGDRFFQHLTSNFQHTLVDNRGVSCGITRTNGCSTQHG